MIGQILAAALLIAVPATAQAQTRNPAADTSSAGFAADADAMVTLVNQRYAYRDSLPGDQLTLPAPLVAEGDAVHDEDSLLHYMEHVLLLLADHHAITGASFRDSWAVVPTYSDIWVEQIAGQYRITAVRDDSPAATAGLRAGYMITGINGQSTAPAIAQFWTALGIDRPSAEQDGFAARVMVAGRRNASRHLAVSDADGTHPRTVTLPSLYAIDAPALPPVTSAVVGASLRITFNNQLFDDATIAAFDAAMADARPGQAIILDLRATPSGGNSSVARAVMSWFVTQPTGYQIHTSPDQERETGIARRWIEQVVPRPGRHHAGPVSVLVGRWTGSMGEGIAVGMAAIGADVSGTPMAGLRGAVEDIRLPNSGLIFKLPVEQIFTIDGIRRENFTPRRPTGAATGAH